jgi:GNAT superfamily N-acetyltransferase
MITLQAEPLTSPDAQRLIAALNADISARYPNPEDNFFELDENEVADGNGAFVIAREDGAAIGCGAIRRIDADTAEVKRMYVAPVARGKRLGVRILAELEREARKLGIRRLVLETGEKQKEAITLYEREGFKRIPNFGEYIDAPLSVCFGKDLAQQ